MPIVHTKRRKDTHAHCSFGMTPSFRFESFIYIFFKKSVSYQKKDGCGCGSPPGVIVADTLSFNAKIGLVDF